MVIVVVACLGIGLVTAGLDYNTGILPAFLNRGS